MDQAQLERTVAASETRDHPLEADARHARMLFCFAVLLAGACGIGFVTQSMQWLVGAIPDDTFYYLQIARQFARTGVSTFDGINPTTGYHPGWMLLMTACAWVLPNPEALVRACVILAFLLHLGCSLLLVRVFRHFMADYWAWTGAALWAINPLPLLMAMHGIETSLYLFTLVLVLVTYLTRIEPHLRSTGPFCPSARELVLFGMSLGVAFWGRTEAILVAAVSIAYLLGAIACCTRTRPLVPALLRTLLFVGASFLLCALPWFLFCYATVGSFSQDSGVMKMIWARQVQRSLPLTEWLQFSIRFLSQNWLGQSQALLTGMSEPGAVYAGASSTVQALWVLVLGGAMLTFRERDRARCFTRVALWLTAVFFATGTVYGMFFTDSQIWHWGQPGLILFVITFGCLTLVLRRLPGLRSRTFCLTLGAALVCGELIIVSRYFAANPALYPFQRDVYASQPKFMALVPRGATVGCFNAGIPAYFGSGNVTNLDGLVNHTVVNYWKTHTFDDYLREAQVSYIADEIDAVRRAQRHSRAPLPLTPVASAPLRGWRHPTRWLWRVEGTRQQVVGSR